MRRKRTSWLWLIPVLLANLSLAQIATSTTRSYLGFDRNEYPGDDNLRILRQTFTFAGFWLNNPPGEGSNSWIGKRKAVEDAGFGFLVLFNGRLYANLKNVPRAVALGKSDAQAAVAAARREGFPAKTLIFLDQEQGGRMLPEQKAYLYTWVDEVNAAGFEAGIYCSGIAAQIAGASVVTADDIRENAGGRTIVYFVSDDACPPSPGCAFPSQPPHPADSGIRFADVWQFAQSPKRRDVAAGCPANYHPDGSCYPPGISPRQGLHVDVETASTPDPSRGRTQKE